MLKDTFRGEIAFGVIAALVTLLPVNLDKLALLFVLDRMIGSVGMTAGSIGITI